MWCWESRPAGEFLPSVCVHELPARSTVGLVLCCCWARHGALTGSYAGAAEMFLALHYSPRALSVWHGVFLAGRKVRLRLWQCSM